VTADPITRARARDSEAFRDVTEPTSIVLRTDEFRAPEESLSSAPDFSFT
jgi:hypothetical protein